MQTHSYSKITSQGQISVPAAVRRSLGLKPGSILEWMHRDAEIVIKRAARCTTHDVHTALFSEPSINLPAKTAAEMKQGIAKLMQAKHARP